MRIHVFERCDTAVAYGLAQPGKNVTVLDEGDDAFRASRGNFGLVWVHGKGRCVPQYARWMRESARQWPALEARLQGETGIDVQFKQPGGIGEKPVRTGTCTPLPATSACD
jgi:glycine/D-amino acid oxidase-like deaminating enzyme